MRTTWRLPRSRISRKRQRGAYVWNNDKDTATLRRSTNAVHDTCSYNSTRYDYKNC
ncbi:hypothetical protein ABT010_34680 [Streptomyces sp. NPDC002668]|uniref:hypothetical protein n=1 Tax=Streptomyces sp. NPDC002668 TaxID=3154422 RepID=UPI0033292866